MTATRLSPARYLEVLHSEGERLLVAAENSMDLPVPTCEGWTADDVVFHVGSVYANKIAALRLGRRPVEGDWQVPGDEATAEDDLAWCHVMLHVIASELSLRASGDYTWTWWEPEQTVGFWQRRMAHETTIHRADVESATGVITPVDADIALDGIDEFVSVQVPRSGVDLRPIVRVSRGAVTIDFAEVAVTGDPSNVLLWLWGRLPDDVVALTGSTEHVDALRAALREAGQ